MSLSRNILNPVVTPGLIYPSYGKRPGRKGKGMRYYRCPQCGGDSWSRLWKEIVRKEESIYGFHCEYCGRNWFISSKLILNHVIEDQILRIANFTKKTGREFGALIIKNSDEVRLEMVEIGEKHEVSFNQTRELKKGESIVGTWHCHPNSDLPSNWDIASFLRDDWEKISIVSGAKGTITVMVATSEMVKVENVKTWIEKNGSLTLKKKGEKFKFLIFRGKSNNLQLIAGVYDNPSVTLEKLLREIV